MEKEEKIVEDGRRKLRQTKKARKSEQMKEKYHRIAEVREKRMKKK